MSGTQEEGVRRFRVEEYYRMAEAGVFAENERVELLEGEVHVLTPRNARHMRVITRLNMLLARKVGEGLSVRVQGPLTLSEESEPEPDLAVVRTEDEAPEDRHPATALLVIEVSQSSLSKDRGIKARLYARAQVTEYWIVNLRQRTVEVYTEPEPQEGRYAVVRTYAPGQLLRCTALPGLELEVEALFGQ